MALFQPTNVLPSTLGGIGAGVVDVTQGITVSWQVNGNSLMEAYRIAIYANNATSTQLYDTGALTSGCPFAGTQSDGTVQLFQTFISPTALVGLSNGNEYKLVVTQYWDSNGTLAPVTQSSASVFYARTAPSLEIDNPPGAIDSSAYTFSATLSQAQGDAVEWFRWVIEDEAGNTLKDTGKIYSAPVIECSYDGFFSGNGYSVQCFAQTVMGVSVQTDALLFGAEYETQMITKPITAMCDKTTAGIRISWDGLKIYPATANGPYTITDDGILSLPDGSSVSWQNVVGNKYIVQEPWTFVWRGSISAQTFSAKIEFYSPNDPNYPSTIIDMSTGGVRIRQRSKQNVWRLPFYTQDFVCNPLDDITLVLTPSHIYLHKIFETGGLYPSETLYPSTTLYPRASTGYGYQDFDEAIPLSLSLIEQITLYGEQQCRYVFVENADTSAELWSYISGTTTGYEAPIGRDTTVFLTDFAGSGLTAGVNSPFGYDITGLHIYRLRVGDTSLKKIAEINIYTDGVDVIDCSVVSQETYSYYVFGVKESGNITHEAAYTNSVSIRFWDWILYQCSQDAAGNYHPQYAFRFGKNLSSGEITNNNSPTISPSFTPYPNFQPSGTNYKSGTLSSLIGVIDAMGDYSDTIELRDRIYSLVSGNKRLYLKDRKGDLWCVRISGAITMSTSDNTREQAQTVSLPWVEVASAENDRIIVTERDETLWTEAEN